MKYLGYNQMNETTIKIAGMSCSGCGNRVQNALKNIEGIEEVEADHTTGMVKVASKSDVSEDAIKEKLTNLGFEVEED